MLHDPAGNTQTRVGLSGNGGDSSHTPPSSRSFFASGPVHAGHLLRGNTGPSTGEARRHLGPSADIDERTSTKTDEKTVEDCFLGLFVLFFQLVFPTITFFPGPWLVTFTPIHWPSTPLLSRNSRK